MSLEELRCQNKEKVIAIALELFVKNGIEHTKIADIAHEAGLTQRSVYRYFATKADIVLACALLFWRQTMAASNKAYENGDFKKLNGAQQIKAVLNAYAAQYSSSRDKLIFIQEAELYLHRYGIRATIEDIPPESFNSGKAPLSHSIFKGLEDKSIKNSDVEINYYNAYDGLLGLMQKMATRPLSDEVDDKARLEAMCNLLAKAFCA